MKIEKIFEKVIKDGITVHKEKLSSETMWKNIEKQLLNVTLTGEYKYNGENLNSVLIFAKEHKLNMKLTPGAYLTQIVDEVSQPKLSVYGIAKIGFLVGQLHYHVYYTASPFILYLKQFGFDTLLRLDTYTKDKSKIDDELEPFTVVHVCEIAEPWFSFIKLNIKTVDTIADTTICVGDKISYYNDQFGYHREIHVRVVRVETYRSCSELLERVGLQNVWPSASTDLAINLCNNSTKAIKISYIN